jgi:hypothetical protein
VKQHDDAIMDVTDSLSRELKMIKSHTLDTRRPKMSQAFRPIRWYVLVLSLLMVSACSQDNTVMGPGLTGSAANQNSTVIAVDAPNFVTWKPNALAKVVGGVDARAEQLVTTAGGSVGGAQTLGIQVDIPAGALREAQNVWVHVVGSEAVQVDFGPSYQFEKPVLVTIDLSNAELAGHNVSDLSIWWFNEDTELWEKIASSSNGTTIFAYVSHFSIYGVGD